MLKRKNNLDVNSKQYKEYTDLYNEISYKSLLELQTLLNLYILKKQDLLRHTSVFSKIPFFFTLCITIITIGCSFSWDIPTKSWLILFLLATTIISFIEIIRIHLINNKIYYCELNIILCNEFLQKSPYTYSTKKYVSMLHSVNDRF